MRNTAFVIIVAISSLFLLAACGQKADQEPGTLVGKITIGPVCPVEPCDQPASSVYVGRELELLRIGGRPIRVPLGEEGSFRVSLEPNTYAIRLEGCNFLGCSEAFPVEKIIGAGETVTLNVDLDIGIRTPGEGQGMALLVAELVDLGAVIAEAEPVSQPFFSVQGQQLIVDGETVQVFTYPSAEAARTEADLVSETGSSVGTTMVTWIGPPHFYLDESMLVIYVGENERVLDLLNQALSLQFAGQEAVGTSTISPRPVMRLSYDGDSHTGSEGSYCWPDTQTASGEIIGICADKIRWGELDESIPVKQGSETTLEIEASDDPQTLSASFFLIGSDTPEESLELGSGSEVPFKVNVPEGTYNVAIFGRWPQGDLSYEFRLEVLP